MHAPYCEAIGLEKQQVNSIVLSASFDSYFASEFSMHIL